MKLRISAFLASLFFSLTLLAAEAQKDMGRIDINSATAQELGDGLTGVGDKTAHAIVDYREKNGPFKNVTELMKVKRIGEKVIEKNKARIDFK